MRIGIDARMLEASGIGRYLKNLITELQASDSTNEYFIFVLKKDYDKLSVEKNFHKIAVNFLWYGYKEQLLFPRLLNQHKLDLVHFPHFNIPVLYRGKFIVTIHDLTHLSFKMSRASAHNRIYYEVKHQVHKQVMYRALKKSLRVITVSNFVKKDLISRCNIESSKIDVIYEGADEELVRTAKRLLSQERQQIIKKLNISSPFLLYVGNAHPHKNIEGLIKVFQAIKNKYKDLQLVLSGREDFFWKRLKHRTHDKDIIFTDFVTEKELAAIYLDAEAFVFPSFSEGFGIPMVEAMAIGCPVVSSNKTALPEVGADAAIYFNPYDGKDMEEKILSVLGDGKLRECLVAQGLKRSRQFSWKRMAQQTLGVYESSPSTHSTNAQDDFLKL